jgi:hypothetical protein
MSQIALPRPGLLFKGIVAKAEKIMPNGTTTEVAIHLPQPNAVLSVRGNKRDDINPQGKRLFIRDPKNPKNTLFPLEASDVRYLSGAVEKVDQQSELHLGAADLFSIGTLADNAQLFLRVSAPNASAWAEVNQIQGDQVNVFMEEGTRLSVEEPSKFKLSSSHLRSDTQLTVTVEGEALNIRG